METISPLTPINPIGSSTSKEGGNSQRGYSPQQGEFVKATVIDVLANKTFSLEIAGSKLTAKSDATLKSGQVLDLQVVKTTPQIELKVMGDNLNQSIGRSLTVLSKNIDVSKLFSQIQSNPEVNLSQISNTSKQTLTNFVSLQQDSLGLQTESKQLTQLIDNLRNALSTPVTAQQTPTQNYPAVKSTLIDIAALIKNVRGTYTSTPSIVKDLPLRQQQVLTALNQLTTTPNTPTTTTTTTTSEKNVDAIVNQISNIIGLTNTAPTAQQINTATSVLQNTVFAFFHLLKGTQPLRQFSGQPPSQSLPQQQSGLAEKNGGVILKTLIDNLGLKLEALLSKGQTAEASKTLKAALLELSHQFQNSKNIADATNRLLSTLEAFQQAQVALEGDKQHIFPIPVPFVEQGYLVVDDKSTDSDDEEDGNKEPNFSIYLTMKELGNIRVDFLNNDEGIYLRFNCESNDKKEFVSEYKDELEEAITTKNVLGISFSDEAGDPATDLIKRFIPEGQSMLNTKV